jgi:putative FmdB family regulatory protein
MPLYTYKCSCGEVIDAFRSIANRGDSPVCKCGEKTRQIIVPTNIAPIIGGGNFPGYKCPVTDQWIDSRKKRREIMKRHDLVEKG